MPNDPDEPIAWQMLRASIEKSVDEAHEQAQKWGIAKDYYVTRRFAEIHKALRQKKYGDASRLANDLDKLLNERRRAPKRK